MREVFTKPKDQDNTAKMFQELVSSSYNGITEEQIARILEIPKRQVRKIAERCNKRLYKEYDNRVKYHKIGTEQNGKIVHKYFRIEKGDVYSVGVIDKRKWDAIAALKTYKMYLEDLGSTGRAKDGVQVDMLDYFIDTLEE